MEVDFDPLPRFIAPIYLVAVSGRHLERIVFEAERFNFHLQMQYKTAKYNPNRPNCSLITLCWDVKFQLMELEVTLKYVFVKLLKKGVT